MSNLEKHAEAEFEVLGWPGECKMQQMVCDNLRELLKVFADQGHSGSSAPYVLGHFMKLANFHPISPLTGADSEWHEVEGDMYQNKRCGEVFKDGKDGKPYWINGRIFESKDGYHYTNGESFVDIEFPWVKPEPEIVKA